MKLATILVCIFSLSCFKSSDLKFDDKFIEGQVAGKPAQLNQKLYVALVNPGSVFNSFIQKNNIGVVKVLDEGMIIGNGYNVDYTKLSKNIERLYPSPQDTGMCFMDIEDPYLSSLHNAGISSKEFKEVLDMYIDAIKFGKKMRPNVKWGHYGVPFTRWDDKDFLVKNDKIEEIYKTVDVLFPSLYLFKDDKEVPFSKNYEYLYDNLSLSLKIGKKYNKPVIPFVLHRFHSDNPRLQWAEMDDKFWKRYIQSVLSINYNGKYAQGIVWWGADTYFYNRPEGKNIRKNFVGTQAEFMSYNDPLLIKKANIVLNVITSKK